ncbi:hypothetical protein Mp_4g18000 [Marchantia polymorpha subsp. ruderalis]|uniref:Uncharacterized protein n=2 Tax=Marchantia polymorpha TaxID=3197 RepID=A0AAF6BB21_MARPO|nr:hypothetical protein MARPO_0041s0081 [Marchantia polymorpha]PTQ40200.1 hypothetical protein MARPO_0041s0081 [Marchantia polymorpha]BBN09204.1 hypothetical protein Mp_4g18000 [Marchantia polymorpha subsp. ruderalis]BBN09205.1 hypothetical protein Mp_4g18000 [Marchantia polymorpha subsp. ruderalis]|eukprot:PTQ40192.1 hypothetical protein MARPO_0041s0081 [Marchantia polymorpha]
MDGRLKKEAQSFEIISKSEERFFEQRRQEEKDRSIGPYTANGFSELHPEKRSLDIIGLEVLSAQPGLHQSMPDSNKVECERAGSSRSKDERESRGLPSEDLLANGSQSVQIVSDYHETDSVVSNKAKADIVKYDNVDAAVKHNAPDTSAPVVDLGFQVSGVQPGFRILDIIKNTPGDVITRRPTSELHATFNLENGYEKPDLYTPHSITKLETQDPMRCQETAETHIDSNISHEVETSCLPCFAYGMSSFYQASNQYGNGFYQPKEFVTTVQNLQEPETEFLNDCGLKIDDQLPVLKVLDRGSFSSMQNLKLELDKKPWDIFDFRPLRRVRCREKKHTNSPVNQCSFPPSLPRIESLSERDFHISPEKCPPGTKDCADIQDDDIQLKYVLTDYGTPRSVGNFQNDDESSYYTSTSSVWDVLDSTSSYCTDSDKIIYGIDEILGEWSSKLDLGALGPRNLSPLEDSVHKPTTRNGPSKSCMLHSPFIGLEGNYNEIFAENSYMIEEDETTNTVNDSNLISIKERGSNEDHESSTTTFCSTEGEVYNMHEFGHVDFVENSENRGTTSSGTKRKFQMSIDEKEPDFLVSFQDSGTETGLPATETMTVYFPYANIPKDKRKFESIGSPNEKEEVTKRVSRLQAADVISQHSLSSQTEPFDGECPYSLNDEENLPGNAAASHEFLSRENDEENCIHQDHKFRTSSNSTNGEVEGDRVQVDDYEEDKMEVDVLLEELHQFEMKINSIPASIIMKFITENHDTLFKQQQQKACSPDEASEKLLTSSNDTGEGSNQSAHVYEPNLSNMRSTNENVQSAHVYEPNLSNMKSTSENVHVNDLRAEKMKIEILSQQLHDFELELLRARPLTQNIHTACKHQEVSSPQPEHEGVFEKNKPASGRSMESEIQRQSDKSGTLLHSNEIHREFHQRSEEGCQLHQGCPGQQSLTGSTQRTQTPTGNQKRKRVKEAETKDRNDEYNSHLEHQKVSHDLNCRQDVKKSRSDHHFRERYDEHSSVNYRHDATSQYKEKFNSHCLHKEKGLEESRDMSKHHRDMDWTSSKDYDKPKAKISSFTSCQDKLHPPGASSKCSYKKKDFSKVYHGHLQESCGSNTNQGSEGLFKTCSNSRKSEKTVCNSGAQLEADCSAKDERCELTRNKYDGHRRQTNQKSSSSDDLRVKVEALAKRETLHHHAASLTSSNRCIGRTPLRQERDFHLSKGKKRDNISQQNSSSESNSTEYSDDNISTRHEDLLEKMKSPNVRQKMDLQVSSQVNEDITRPRPYRSISDNKDENEVARCTHQQRAQISNEGDRQEENMGGLASHDQRITQGTPTINKQVGVHLQGNRYTEEVCERDPQPDYEDTKRNSRSSHLLGTWNSDRGVILGGTCASANSHRQETSVRPSFPHTHGQLPVNDDHSVKGNNDIKCSFTEVCSRETNSTELLCLGCLKTDQPHHPQCEKALLSCKYNRSSHLQLSTDQGMVKAGEEETQKSAADLRGKMDCSSQGCKVQQQVQVSDFVLHQSLEPPVETLQGQGSQPVSDGPNQDNTGGPCRTEVLKLTETQHTAHPTTDMKGGHTEQGTRIQYVTMLESFVMQLTLENKILQ